MNLEAFSRFVRRLGFKKNLVFFRKQNAHLKEVEHIYNSIIENIYVI